MKKTIIIFGLLPMLGALSGCTTNEENIEPVLQNDTFELVASSATRTAVDPDDAKQTKWVAGDAITVMHCPDGETTFVNDGEFTVAADDTAIGRFTGTLGGPITPAKSYEWYALYPHSADNAAVGSPTESAVTIVRQQTQTGADRNHICGANAPLAGKATAGPAATPSIDMSHLTTLMKFTVSNPTSEAITVVKIKFGTSIQMICGAFLLNSSGGIDPQSASYNNAELTVSGGGEIAVGGSADFFLAVAPFTAAANEVLTVMVILADGRTCTKGHTVAAATSFAAGKVNKLSVDFAADTKYYERYQSYISTTKKCLITSIAPTILVMDVSTETPVAPAADLRVYYDSERDRFVSTTTTDGYFIEITKINSETRFDHTLKTRSGKYIGSNNGLSYSTAANDYYKFAMALNSNYESSTSMTYVVDNKYNFLIKWNPVTTTFGNGTKGVRIYVLNE